MGEKQGEHTMQLGGVALLAMLLAADAARKPNIVWFLTDDQDQMLGASFPTKNGATPMPKTRAMMADAGATANNMFIHTPICCPSRSELLSGRYFHNIKKVGGKGTCMHADELKVNNNTFARYLKEEAGYTVGMFGKYLNNMPTVDTAGQGSSSTGATVVPAGFDAWMANGGGDYLASPFNVQNISFGDYKVPDGVWKASSIAGTNYSTSIIGNISIAWIQHVVKQDPTRPFFAYIAPKAAHEPFNPAPWYVDHWEPSWPAHEPRPINWNCSAAIRANHHGNVATEPMISEAAATVITDVFKNRWRTLMSVDDLIGSVIDACTALGVMDNTYFFYSSDHGFQLGQFNIPMDKRQPYDWDTRIHLLARGPGIKPGSSWDFPSTQVDLAATFLGIAGVDKPAQMDGKSLVPLLISAVDTSALPQSTQTHLTSLGDAASYAAQWRDAVFIEYYYNDFNTKCVGNCSDPGKMWGYPHHDTWCGDLNHNSHCWALYGCNTDCYETESPENNYIGLRSMGGSQFGDSLYAEFQTGDMSSKPIDFVAPDSYELYNATEDPWMVRNLYSSESNETLKKLHQRLWQFYQCSGDSCP